LGWTTRVRLLGFRRDVAELMAGSQVFVLSSRSEAFPYSILEAMRAALPVVATDVGGIREAVIPEENGPVVSGGRSGRLQSSLGRIVNDPEAAEAHGRGRAPSVLSHFNLRENAGQYRSRSTAKSCPLRRLAMHTERAIRAH